MEEQDFSLRRFFGVLKRQFLVIVLVLVVVLTAASVVIFSLKPEFQATTLVLVDPSNKNLLNPVTGGSNASSENARVESEVSIVKAETTLEAVLQEAKLLDDPAFGITTGLRQRLMVMLRLAPPVTFTPAEQRQTALAKLRDIVVVQRQGLTYLITISATAGQPEKAAQLANTMANMYIRAQVQSKVNGVLAGRDVLAERVTEATTSVVASEQAFSDFIVDSAGTIAESTGRTDLEDIRLEIIDAAAARGRQASAADLAETALASQNWLEVANVLDNQTLTNLQQRQADLEVQLRDVVEGSPAATELRAQLVALLDTFRSEASAEVERLRSEVAASRAREADLQLQLRSAILTSDLPPQVLAKMYELQQNAEIARAQYEQLLQRLREIEAQAYLQLADSRVVSAATPPEDPSFPNIPFMLVGAGMLALGLGLALAFLRENYVGGITSPEQLEGALRTSLVATLPNQKKNGTSPLGGPSFSLSEIIVAQPYSVYADAVRRVMVSIDQLLRRMGSRDEGSGAAIIMVTSANANEGKTTIALSLARAYAQAGASTVLIDADLRRPSVHKELGMAPSERLMTYLSNSKSSEDISSVLIKDPLSNAKVVIGNSTAMTPGGPVVTGEMFSKLLARAAAKFDIVIIDTPPVGAIVDALHLAKYADVIVTAVRWASTSQREARAALRDLTDAKEEEAEMLCILNAAPQSKAETKRRFKGYYTA